MKKPNNQLSISKATNCLTPDPSIKSIKVDTFNKPRHNLGVIPPGKFYDFLLEIGICDGDRFICVSQTNLPGQVIRWRGTYSERTQNVEIKELSGRKSTKGQTHTNGFEWINKNCLGRFSIEFEGVK